MATEALSRLLAKGEEDGQPVTGIEIGRGVCPTFSHPLFTDDPPVSAKVTGPSSRSTFHALRTYELWSGGQLISKSKSATFLSRNVEK